MSTKVNQLHEDFEKACNEIKKCKNINNETLLILYGLYKQAKEGNCNISKPNFLDIKGQSKWEAWDGNKDMDKDVAMRRYIRKVKNILEQ